MEGDVKRKIKFFDWEDHNRQPLLKHGNVGVLVKIITREKKLFSFACDYQ